MEQENTLPLLRIMTIWIFLLEELHCTELMKIMSAVDECTRTAGIVSKIVAGIKIVDKPQKLHSQCISIFVVECSQNMKLTVFSLEQPGTSTI